MLAVDSQDSDSMKKTKEQKRSWNPKPLTVFDLVPEVDSICFNEPLHSILVSQLQEAVDKLNTARDRNGGFLGKSEWARRVRRVQRNYANLNDLLKSSDSIEPISPDLSSSVYDEFWGMLHDEKAWTIRRMRKVLTPRSGNLTGEELRKVRRRTVDQIKEVSETLEVYGIVQRVSITEHSFSPPLRTVSPIMNNCSMFVPSWIKKGTTEWDEATKEVIADYRILWETLGRPKKKDEIERENQVNEVEKENIKPMSDEEIGMEIGKGYIKRQKEALRKVGKEAYDEQTGYGHTSRKDKARVKMMQEGYNGLMSQPAKDREGALDATLPHFLEADEDKIEDLRKFLKKAEINYLEAPEIVVNILMGMKKVLDIENALPAPAKTEDSNDEGERGGGEN